MGGGPSGELRDSVNGNCAARTRRESEDELRAVRVDRAEEIRVHSVHIHCARRGTQRRKQWTTM